MPSRGKERLKSTPVAGQIHLPALARIEARAPEERLTADYKQFSNFIKDRGQGERSARTMWGNMLKLSAYGAVGGREHGVGLGTPRRDPFIFTRGVLNPSELVPVVREVEPQYYEYTLADVVGMKLVIVDEFDKVAIRGFGDIQQNTIAAFAGHTLAQEIQATAGARELVTA